MTKKPRRITDGAQIAGIPSIFRGFIISTACTRITRSRPQAKLEAHQHKTHFINIENHDFLIRAQRMQAKYGHPVIDGALHMPFLMLTMLNTMATASSIARLT